MSFWSHSPGPTWWHWFESLFVCKDQDIGLLDATLHKKPVYRVAPSGTQVVPLSELNAKEIESLLSQHYQTFPRSKIFLSAQRIREGFLYDGWMGVGVFLGLKCIGCAISRDLGTITVRGNDIPRVGFCDFFCVAEQYRKKGIASLLLQEFVIHTGKQGRLVHIFQKEGLPISPLPPIWQSSYIWRRKGVPGESADYIGKEGIGTRSHIRSFTYTSYVPIEGCIHSTPTQLSGDSELYSFSYRGFSLVLCITDTFHRSVPEGWKIGELQWILPNGDVPKEIQELAVEALVDTCKYDLVLMDTTLPHQKTKGWQKDAPFGYYLYNYNPAHFFSLKPYFVF